MLYVNCVEYWFGMMENWKHTGLANTVTSNGLFLQQYIKNDNKSKFCITGPLWIESTGGFPHEGPLMRKAVPCHDVIIKGWLSYVFGESEFTNLKGCHTLPQRYGEIQPKNTARNSRCSLVESLFVLNN